MPLLQKSSVKLLLLLTGILILILASCGAPQSAPSPAPAPAPSPASTPATPPQTPSPTPDPTKPPPAVTWKPDGTISPGEYRGSKTYGDYEIHYGSDDNYLYIAMKSKTTGWVSVGFQPNSTMKDADIIFGYVQDNKAFIFDMYGQEPFGLHPPDNKPGGTQDIVAFGGTESNGFTIIEFNRALTTGDKYDRAITKGAIKIIWAYGSIDEISNKHSARGYGTIDL